MQKSVLCFCLFLFLSLGSSGQPEHAEPYKTFYDFYDKGDYKNALTASQKIVTILPITPVYTRYILHLSKAYYFTGDFSSALDRAAEGKQLMYRNREDVQPATGAYLSIDSLATLFISIQSAMAEVFSKRGNTSTLLTIYKSIVDVCRDFSYTEKSSFYTKLLFDVSLESGNYKDAETVAGEVLQDYKLRNDTSSLTYANLLHDIGNIYSRVGKFDYCISLYHKSAAIFRTVKGPHSIHYMQAVITLSYHYYRMGNRFWDKADSLAAIAGNIAELYKYQYPDHYFDVLLVPLNTYITRQQYGKADSICRLLDKAVLNVTAANQDICRANYADRLAYYAKKKGNLKQADSLYTLSLRLQERNKTGLSLKYSWTLQGQGSLYLDQREYDKAEHIFSLRNQFDISQLHKEFPTLSAASKINYLNNNYVTTLSYSSYCLLFRSPDRSLRFKTDLFNLELLSKSLVMDQTADLYRIVNNEKDSALLELFFQWKALRKKIYTSRLSSTQSSAALEALEQQADLLETRIAQRSATFKTAQSAYSISLKDVQEKLAADEAAIEFVRFCIYDKDWTDSTMYGAFIVKKNNPEPIFVPLFESKSLQQVFDTAYKSTRSVKAPNGRGLVIKRKNVNEFNRELYRLLWAPLEPYLKNIKAIAFAPTGQLYKIAFHSLQKDSTQLLMDLYRLRQYTSTRQVALRDSSSEKKQMKTAALYGDALFNIDKAGLQWLGKKEKVTAMRLFANPAYRFIDSLPSTRFEVESISKFLQQRKTSTIVYKRENASEENLKRYDGQSPAILHIATHGYYSPVIDSSTQAISSGNDTDPFIRSGLYLAGASYALSGLPALPGIEDGIITAYEIAEMDLSQTELVVLSACQTGLGDIKESEGVYGLQRAFKIAGVKKMIISLWEVPDKSTADLMKAFYQYWTPGKTIAGALDMARRKLRIDYPQVRDWAAFVLID